MTAQQKFDNYKSKYPSSFDVTKLDSNLPTVQLWNGGTMLTAQLSISDAKKGVGTSYYIISSQAVGTISSLLE